MARGAWRLATLFAALLWIAAPASPQGGYSTEKFPQYGLTFRLARHYEAVPTQPDEQWILLQYIEDLEVTKRKERRARPEMSILQIRFVPDPEPAPVAANDEEPKEGREAERTTTKIEAAPISTFERYVERVVRGWDLGTAEASDKEQDAYKGREYRLYPGKKNRTNLVGWAFTWQGEGRTIAVLGFCDEGDFDEQVKIWRRTAEGMKIEDPEEEDDSSLLRYYERRRMSHPEYRAKVRSSLVDGWDIEDTDNYVVVFSTKDQPLVRRICREIEQLRLEYVKLFPPVGEFDAVSTVRICKDRPEYLQYSNLPTSAGYWNSETEELVLYDAAVRSKDQRSDDLNTFIALYHEAFHQYIYYSAGELPPHSWFNEGHGDYFSGALIKGGKVKKIGPNPWRVRLIKRAVETNNYVPWKDILSYEQKDYYDRRRVAVCYAEGWSMIYFLRESKEVARRPEWAGILDKYFNALKEAYADELAKAGNPTAPKARQEPGLRARQRALEVAFDGVDIQELEEAWKDFVEDLEDPNER